VVADSDSKFYFSVTYHEYKPLKRARATVLLAEEAQNVERSAEAKMAASLTKKEARKATEQKMQARKAGKERQVANEQRQMGVEVGIQTDHPAVAEIGVQADLQ